MTSGWASRSVLHWLLKWLRRADLRSADGLRHAEENDDALTATAGRESFIRCPEATINVLPVVYDPDIACRSDREIGLHLQAAADITAGRRDLGADTAKLDDWALRTSEIGDPHIVVAVDRRSKSGGQAAAREGGAGVLAAVWPQQRHAAPVRTTLLLVHRTRHHLDVLAAAFQGIDHPPQGRFPNVGGTKSARYPDVALAVDAEPATAITRLESFDLVGVGGRKACDPGSQGLGYPDTVLLVDS